MTGNREKALIEYVDELNLRIQSDPENKMQIIKEFYSEMVKAGKTEVAHMVLDVRDMMNAGNGRNDTSKVPGWFLPAGFVTGVLTLLFFMSLVLLSVGGHEVPPGSRFLVVAVLAFGCALSAAFIGGQAATKGKIPFFGDKNPLAISATGGIAVLIIVMALGYYFYAK